MSGPSVAPTGGATKNAPTVARIATIGRIADDFILAGPIGLPSIGCFRGSTRTSSVFDLHRSVAVLHLSGRSLLVVARSQARRARIHSAAGRQREPSPRPTLCPLSILGGPLRDR